MTSEPAGEGRHEKMMLVETIGSVLWFVMDGLWMLNQGGGAKGMIAPALAVNLYVYRYTPRSFSQFAVVSAMNSWLLMNVFWMVGDLDKDARALGWARVFFVAGMVLLAAAVGRNALHPERLGKVLAPFRRLRV